MKKKNIYFIHNNLLFMYFIWQGRCVLNRMQYLQVFNVIIFCFLFYYVFQIDTQNENTLHENTQCKATTKQI